MGSQESNADGYASRPQAVGGSAVVATLETENLTPVEFGRWEVEAFARPPHHYRSEFCVLDKKGNLRPPSVEEWERLLDFKSDHSNTMVRSVTIDDPKVGRQLAAITKGLPPVALLSRGTFTKSRQCFTSCSTFEIGGTLLVSFSLSVSSGESE